MSLLIFLQIQRNATVTHNAFQWAGQPPKIAPKIALPLGNVHLIHFLGLTCFSQPNGISISSAVVATWQQKQRPTDRPCYSSCSNRPHPAIAAMRRKINRLIQHTAYAYNALNWIATKHYSVAIWNMRNNHTWWHTVHSNRTDQRYVHSAGRQARRYSHSHSAAADCPRDSLRRIANSHRR